MLRIIALTIVAVAIAIGGGAASVWYALSGQQGIGAVTIGAWTTFPEMGQPHADPYSSARAAREGLLVLGRAEGLAFVAERDSAGETLRRECSYSVEGFMPAARLWTLFAASPALVALSNGNRHAAALNSQQTLRKADNSVAIGVSARPEPGNWLAVSGSGPMSLVLTFYDTPIASSAGPASIVLPQVLKVACDA